MEINYEYFVYFWCFMYESFRQYKFSSLSNSLFSKVCLFFIIIVINLFYFYSFSKKKEEDRISILVRCVA